VRAAPVAKSDDAAPAHKHKFLELMPPNENLDFVGKRKFFSYLFVGPEPARNTSRE